MTTPQLVDDLKRDEGVRNRAYVDSLGNMTIGVGHLMPKGSDPNTEWTDEEVLSQLNIDIAAACDMLDRNVGWWRKLDDVLSDALANMAFNLDSRLLGFHHMLGALDAHDWVMASEEALDSAWASQTGARAQRIAYMFRNGERQS
jgi:lysozyme